MNDLKYGYEWNGYVFDDYGREIEVSEYKERTAKNVFHSEKEDMWFFEAQGVDYAESYAEKFREDGNKAELIEVPLGYMLRVVRKN